MEIYKRVPAAHAAEDMDDLIAAVALGDAIERHLTSRTSPFAAMIERAREGFIAAQSVLLDADLLTPEGIAAARCAQAEARRYRDMCSWIGDCLTEREEAADYQQHLDPEEEEPAVEELKEQLYGPRAKPAPDA